LGSSAQFVHNLFEGPITLAMLDGFPQPAAQKRFEFAFFLCRGRLVRICDIGADA
jgi:hypothetical protein